MTLFNNAKGFTAIEALAAASIMALTIFTVFTMYTAGFRINKQAAIKIDELEIMRELQLNFADKAICDLNFKDKSLSSNGNLSINQLGDQTNQPLIQAGQRLSSQPLTIANIRINTQPTIWNLYKSAQSGVSTAGYSLNSTLEITFVRSYEKPPQPFIRTLPLPLKVSNQAKILGCLGAASADLMEALLSKNCTDLGGNYDTTQKICTLKSNCANLDPNKPLSQKCVAEILTPLEEQINAQLKLIPPKPTPPPPLPPPAKDISTGIGNNVAKCLSKSTTITRTASEITCDYGGYSAVLSAASVEIRNSNTTSSTKYQITDPDLAQQLYNQAVAIYDSMPK